MDLNVSYRFGNFRVDPSRRLLEHNGEPVTLTAKAFDTLLLLVQNPGRVLEKDKLIKALWPDSFVEENNLSQHIFTLRKTLGDDENGNRFIETIPKTGYQFVAPVSRVDSSAANAVENNSNDAESRKKSFHISKNVEYWIRHSPFRGLRAFEPEDSWLFFGRDSDIEELLASLGRSPALAVVGSSGSGKSSLVRAGLVPALHQGRLRRTGLSANSWRVALFRPSESPFDYLAEVLPGALASSLSCKEQAEFIALCRKELSSSTDGLRNAILALAGAGTEQADRNQILLIVDQFEELFTLTENRKIRDKYIDALLTASGVDGPVAVHLVLVLRADFYAHCLEHPGLSRCLQANLYNVPRMRSEQLRENIEKRLALASASAEPGLIDSLLEEIGSEPGNLALLEHALDRLWEKCGGFGCTLTNEAYSAMGRLRGALSAHADEVYTGITDSDQKRLVQKVFLELVHFGEGTPDTRRRVPKEELLSLGQPQQVEPLLARLASNRLISIGGTEHESFAEVSHEALIREWSTLREWAAQNREELRLGRRLVQAAQEWQDLNRDPGALLQGARLVQAEDWRVTHRQAPSLVREFLHASIAAQVKAEARNRRRLRWFCYALASLLILAVAATWFVHRRQVLAESRALAAQSELYLLRDQGQALDLAMRGWSTAQTADTYTALTLAAPQMLTILNHEGEVIVSVFSPGGERVLTASYDHTARVWSTADGHLLATLQGHTDKIEDAAFSPDGQRIVTASHDHTARVWNAANGHLLEVLKGHTNKIYYAAFSPDGQRILTTSEDHTARVWNSVNGHLLATLRGHSDMVFFGSFSPDGQHIATASLDQTARVWDAAEGRLLVTLQGHTHYVLDVEFSPDGQRIITASYDGTAKIWNTVDGRLLSTLPHGSAVRRVMFSPDGLRVVTASADNTARIWNLADGRLLAVLHHDGTVNHAEFSPDGKRVATASLDHTARIWNSADGRLLATLQGHTASVTHISFSPDGQRIVTGSYDHSARLWNISGGRLLAALRGHTDIVHYVTFSPDGQRIATASFDHTVRVWNTADGGLLTVLRGHSDVAVHVVFSPDGQRIATASYDHTARVWNTADGHLLATLQGHSDKVWAVAFSPDGQRIATASYDHTARIWNTVDGHLLATLQGHTGTVWAVRFFPDGGRIATASDDDTVRVWNTVDGHLVATLQGNTGKVDAVVFSPDGQRFATAGDDRTARIWNTADGILIATLQGHTDRVRAVAFSPDGQRIATASDDHTARVWNTADGHLLATLQGHTDKVDNVAFSPNGQRIATASDDHTAGVWNSADGHLIAALQGHTDRVWAVAFSPDGRRIVTSSVDHTARLWQVLTFDDFEKALRQ